MPTCRPLHLGALCLLPLLAAPAQAQEARAPQVLRDCDACPEMVVVPAGAFMMTEGAGSEAVLVRVPRPFALGRHEVTRAEFARFIRESGHEVRAGCRTWDAALQRFNDDGRRSWENPGRPAEPAAAHPVSCVSWADAQAYAGWLARKTGKRYRLPSEAEWEYAARAGSTTLRPWGDAPEAGCEFANTYDRSAQAAYRLGWSNAACADGFADLAPVGQLRPNAFGLHDMIGNVAEWVEDCYTASYVGRPRDARAWTWLGGCQRRVQRGGGWVSPPQHSQSGHRAAGDATERADYLGFRVALDLDERREAR
jgi:formylglycine-generating enzyme required for sulfatase activity